MRRALVTCLLPPLLFGCASSVGEAPAPIASSAPAPSLFDEPWVFSDEQGAAVQLSRWRGLPLVVAMIYTSCTSTCPVTVERLLRMNERLERGGHSVEFVLVTLDPASDTPEKLRSFKAERRLPARWHLLRGSDEETQDLADFLGIKLIDDGSHILHDGTIEIFDRAGRMTGRLGS